MGNGIRLFKIFGININVDWSWIFIFVLVTWNLAAGVFPSIHPTWSAGQDWTLGIIASLLFFASVLAHELAHSLVAVSRGLPVRRITLFLFGGVSNIQREPESPGTEFLVAIVGPLTSIILGIIFLVLGYVSGGTNIVSALRNPIQALAGLNPVATLLLWLGPINIILGIFNLVPGFPLDGGRVLRSIIWGITNNLKVATRWASWAGQLIAWGFILMGISMFFGVRIPFFGTGFISGLWLAFIGWFLNNAAIQSYRQVVIQDALEGIPVSRLMFRSPTTISPDLPVSQLVDHFIMGTDERSFPVMQADQLVGVVTLEDVRKIPRDQWDATTVRQIMTPKEELETVNPREDVAEAMDVFNRRDVRQLPVIQDGQFVGMLRRRDIMRWLQLQSDISAHNRMGSD
jgi:Zn-dependent protease